MNKINFRHIWSILVLGVLLWSCDNNNEPDVPDNINPALFQVNQGVFILNEGGFGYGNASVDYLNLNSGQYFSNIFQAANNRPLGDVLQSMYIRDDRAYLMVNNSSRIDVVGLDSFQLIGSIQGLSSPRYMLQTDDQTAFVSDFKADGVHVINPQTFAKTGFIPITGWTEEMVRIDDVIYVCNRFSDYVYMIDIEQQTLVDSIKVAYGSGAVVKDNNDHLWVYCAGNQKGGIYHIDPVQKTLLDSIVFNTSEGLFPSLQAPEDGATVYYGLGNAIYSFDVSEPIASNTEVVTLSGRTLYGFNLRAVGGNIFVLDAKDYQQKGDLLIYSGEEELLNVYETGVIPNHVVFY